ncbi:hypothetical protein AB5I41_07810 [Sphingomonas sp. MMS24-JH45]
MPTCDIGQPDPEGQSGRHRHPDAFGRQRALCSRTASSPGSVRDVPEPDDRLHRHGQHLHRQWQRPQGRRLGLGVDREQLRRPDRRAHRLWQLLETTLEVSDFLGAGNTFAGTSRAAQRQRLWRRQCGRTDDHRHRIQRPHHRLFGEPLGPGFRLQRRCRRRHPQRRPGRRQARRRHGHRHRILRWRRDDQPRRGRLDRYRRGRHRHADDIEIVDDSASGRTLLVGNGGFATIQAAVDAANDGDTILVAAGTYASNVSIAKDVTLVGAHAGQAGRRPVAARMRRSSRASSRSALTA